MLGLVTSLVKGTGILFNKVFKLKRNKLVRGWGINDVPYDVYRYEFVSGVWKIIWICPYYSKWAGILERVFSEKLHAKYPTYKNCTITENWKYLSNFIEWVDSQPNRDWENCEPDKDLINPDNKHYAEDTVVFINHTVNSFLTNGNRGNSKLMIGTTYVDWIDKYKAQCNNPLVTKSYRYLGCFPTELEAHLVWKAKKHEYACQLADLQDDPRVADALRKRYAPDTDWTK